MKYAGAVLILLLTVPSRLPAQADAETFFELKVRPVLARHCFKCHGGDKTGGGLRVDTREALLKGGERGPAVVPGRAADSLLASALRHDEQAGVKMPPDGKLPEDVRADLAAWIDAGAPWPAARPGQPDAFAASRHWAFRPVKAVEPPPDPTGWADHPIDRFVAAKWRERGLTPAPPAGRRALARRVFFDLIGLPPTPDEMRAFLADEAPDAFARLVDRLLASPHYGERWGRHWLDVVRYADTAGDNADYPVPEARLYRDYVIDSFNADKPYDRFVREQLAGDLLAARGPREDYAEGVIATTYLGLSRRYLTAPYEHWHLTLEDVLDTTGRAFLGLTLRCARCHDHKYDPVSTRDYYALYGVFASTRFPYAGSEEFASQKRPREHFVALVPPEEAAPRLEERARKVAELTAAVARAEKEKSSRLAAARAELEAWRRTNLPPGLPGAYAVGEGKPVDAAVQVGGDPDKPGPVVRRGVPRFLDGPKIPVIPEGQSGRLQLAEWLTGPRHPLTARVLVNRIWQHHFGRGLVATPSNFGLRGEAATHPELLDWLAAEFLASPGPQPGEGWSIKRVHRLILSSKTYQLASTHEEAQAARDPGNVWYGRFDRRRLDAEAIRDALLAVGGNLDRRRPGPHPFPPITAWGWTQHTPFKDVYPSAHRSVYLMTQRLQRHPFLALFDGPDTNVSTDVRTTATVPLQALFLRNNPFVEEQARGLARRLLVTTTDPDGRLTLACELCWGRSPTAGETDAAREYLARYRQGQTDPGTTGGEEGAWASLARVLLASNEFVYVD